MSDIWTWSATETSAAIKRGDISSREAVEAAVGRLEEVEPIINAFEDRVEDVLAQADRADARRARREEIGPLHGVPIAIKDNHDLTGFPTTHGVPAFAGLPASTRNSPPVDRYVESGAIVIGRTRMPPFGLRWTTQSDFFGPTRNPHDPSVTAGASTGGGAAAVASGVVPIVQGNDIGGSLRYPGTVCGVVGLRPTIGKVPWWSAPEGAGMRVAAREFQVEGPIARTVADLRLALSVIAQPDPRDPDATPSHVAPATGRPRIGVLVDPGTHPFAGPSTPEVDASVREAAAALSVAGYEVDEITTPIFGESAGLWLRLAFADFERSGLGDQLEQFGDEGMRFKYRSVIALVEEAFGPIDLTAYLADHERRSIIRRELSELMVDYPVILTPNSGEPPFELGSDVTSQERVHQVLRNQWPNLGVPFLGLPGVGLATKVRPRQAPLGVQLIGRAFDEATILDVAEDLQKASPVPSPVDPVAPGAH